MSTDTVLNDDAHVGTSLLAKRRRLDNDSGLRESPTLVASSFQESSSLSDNPLGKSYLTSILEKLAASLRNVEDGQSIELLKTPVNFKLTNIVTLTLASSNEIMQPSLDRLYAELLELSIKVPCNVKNAPFCIHPVLKRIEALLPPGQVLFISPDEVGGPKGNFTDWRLIIAPQASSMNRFSLTSIVIDRDGEEASQATNFYFMDASRMTKDGTVSVDDTTIIDLALHNMHHLAVKCGKSVIRGVISNGFDYAFLMLQIPTPDAGTCNYSASISIGMQYDEESVLHKLTADVISSAVARWAMDSNSPEIDEQWFKLKAFPPQNNPQKQLAKASEGEPNFQ
ncbi:hypothetical protein ONZ45_g17094 [Pleurotus djamor]|nr:hypothetical protein ONZ45_g17094 [Pleurotus djamor]